MKFEDAGRALDREIARLSVFLDRKVKPKTRQEMAKVLRRAARQLSKIAEELEKAQSRKAGAGSTS